MIIYFTGSGNSLSFARDLAKILDERIIHITKVDKVEIEKEKTIGIVYPCYYGDLPDIVRKIINGLSFSSAEYIFGITIHGGDPGNCLHTLQKIIKKKGSKLAYGEEVLTPVNSRIMYGRITTDVDKRVKEARSSVKRIGRDIKERKDNSSAIKKRLIPTIVSKLPIMDLARKFLIKNVDSSRCTRCGTCEKVCSLENIKVDEEDVHIGNNCTECLACLHWCPEAAIGFGRRKVRKEQQYHHIDVNLNDMIMK
jgi:ferredoxin